MGHLTFLSKRPSAVGNKRISQYFASACEPRSRAIALVDSMWVFSVVVILYSYIMEYAFSDLISIKSNSLYNLRSTGKPLLDHPKGKMLSTLGARSAALKLWNGLPVELRQATSLDSFKSKLKTYLVKKYFDNL